MEARVLLHFGVHTGAELTTQMTEQDSDWPVPGTTKMEPGPDMWMDSPQSQARSGRVSPPWPPPQSTPGLQVPPLTSQDPRDACSFALPCPPNRTVWGNGLRSLFTHPLPVSLIISGLGLVFFQPCLSHRNVGQKVQNRPQGPGSCQEHPERGAASVRQEPTSPR